MEIISGPEIHAKVIDLISQAKSQLVLISPYFKPWRALNLELKSTIVSRKVKTFLVLRKGEENDRIPTEAETLKDAGARLFFVERLHAKLYLSESTGILTSMNLLESSALDSWEIGVRVTKERDPDDFAKFHAEAEKILKKALDEAKLSAISTLNAIIKDNCSSHETKNINGLQPRAYSRATTSHRGFCLRCRASIELDASKPLCRNCYSIWAEYNNAEYPEQFCLRCGSSSEVTVSRPHCKSCFRLIR